MKTLADIKRDQDSEPKSFVNISRLPYECSNPMMCDSIPNHGCLEDSFCFSHQTSKLEAPK